MRRIITVAFGILLAHQAVKAQDLAVGAIAPDLGYTVGTPTGTGFRSQLSDLTARNYSDDSGSVIVAMYYASW